MSAALRAARSRNMGRIKISIGLAFGALVAPVSGWAQGCVLCYTSVANGGPGAMRAFQMGILALLAPALLLCVAVALLIFRRARIANGAPLPSYTSMLQDAARSLYGLRNRSSAPKRIGHSVRDAV
jgi:hypothetical protein